MLFSFDDEMRPAKSPNQVVYVCEPAISSLVSKIIDDYSEAWRPYHVSDMEGEEKEDRTAYDDYETQTGLQTLTQKTNNKTTTSEVNSVKSITTKAITKI